MRLHHPADDVTRAQPTNPTGPSPLAAAIGNRAMTRLATQGGARILARRPFASLTAASAWLGKKEAQGSQDLDAWLNALLDADKGGFADKKDRTANLALLKQAAGGETGKVAKKVERKARLTDDIKSHIAKGGIGTEGQPIGYHTKKDKAAVCEAVGATKDLEYGCYWQAVQLKGKPDKKKGKGSTFFPDAWDLATIWTAIETASERKGRTPLFEVTQPKSAAGLMLFFNGDSFFPYFDDD